MRKLLSLFLIATSLTACDEPKSTADQKISAAQARTLNEAVAQVGMPEIINWQEKRMMKQLYELRDKSISTHSYIVNSMTGCLIYLGSSVGYGIPYAAQYSAPHKAPYKGDSGVHYEIISNEDQAEPNGLFMPADARGTWVMIKEPNGKDIKPVYIEPDVIVSPFRLASQECK